MKSLIPCTLILLLSAAIACSGNDARGVADKRSDFRSFIPLKTDPALDGLRAVHPFFHHADRAEIIRAIEKACFNGRSGSSVYDEGRGAGYYVNCNASNKQLLNGYVPANSHVEPHSRPN